MVLPPDEAAAYRGPYSGPLTAEYKDTVRFAQNALNQSGQAEPTAEIADSVWRQTTRLDSEVLDAARYSGMGVVLGGMMTELAAPGVRQSIVDQGARSLVTYWRTGGSRNPQGLMLSDLLNGSALSPAFLPAATSAVKGVLPSIRIATEALGIEAADRERRHHSPTFPPRTGFTPPDMTSFLAGELTRDTAKSNMSFGATLVMQAVLFKRYAHLSGQPELANQAPGHEQLYTLGGRVSLRAALGTSTLDQLGLTDVARMAAARLRKDTFITRVGDFIQITDAGVAKFNNPAVPRAEELPPIGIIPAHAILPAAQQHEGKYVCPAAFVLNPDLIGAAVGMTVEMVTQAHDQIQTDLGRKTP